MGSNWDSLEVERHRDGARRCRRMADLFSDALVRTTFETAAYEHERDAARLCLSAWHWTDDEPS